MAWPVLSGAMPSTPALYRPAKNGDPTVVYTPRGAAVLRPTLRTLFALALAVGSQGCSAVFLGVPPCRLEVATGARVATQTGVAAVGDAPVAVRAGVHPLQLVKGTTDRRFDFGAGYFVDAKLRPDGVPTQQGLYAEEQLFARPSPSTGGLRVGAAIQERLVAGRSLGPGFAARLTFEDAAWFAGSTQEPKSASSAYGEGAVGLFLEGDVAFVDGTRTASVLGGLTFRIPAAGIASK